MFENESDFEKMVSRLDIDTEPNPAHREKLRQQMLSTFNETHVGPWQKFGRAIVRRPITKLAVAAAIIVIALVGTYYLGSPIDGTTVAWGEVIERIKKIHTFSAQSKRTFTVVGEEKPVFECEVYKYFSPEHGYMEEQYIDGELGMLAYGLFEEKLMIFVFPTMKQYLRLKLDEQTLLLIEHINPMNPEALIELFGSEKCKKLGSKEINGIKADGIEVKDLKVFLSVPRLLFQLESIDIRLWIDPETFLPIEMEAEGIVGKGLLTGFKDMMGKSVMHKIEYDVELNTSIFEPNIPDDFTLLDVKASLKKAGAVGVGILLLGIVIWFRLRKGRKKNRYVNQ